MSVRKVVALATLLSLGIGALLVGSPAARAGGKKEEKKESKALNLKAFWDNIFGRLERANDTYRRAFNLKLGKITDWRAYFDAQKELKSLYQIVKSKAKELNKAEKGLADKLQSWIKELFAAVKKKESPDTLRVLTSRLAAEVNYLPPQISQLILPAYSQTLARIQNNVVARTAAPPYEVNLFLLSNQPFYFWREVDRDEVHSKISPPKKPSFSIGVFIRHLPDRSALAGTDVSVEILNTKGKQLSTTKLFLAWEGYPYYLGFIPLPKEKKFILQVSISPFPLDRAERQKNALLSGTTAKFEVTWNPVKPVFKPLSKAQPLPLLPKSSDDILPGDLKKAFASVGFHFAERGPYRLGFAVVKLSTVWKWKGGSLSPENLKGKYIVLAFLQEKSSGFLFPNARLHAYFYWREKTGLIRSHLELKPIFAGFYGYYAVADLKPIPYRVRVRIDPPLMVTYQPELPPIFAVIFDNFLPPLK